MQNSVALTLTMAVAALLVLALPILVGVYVHKDAKRRNMDATLWTLVTILVPSLIGFIIYLVVRNNVSDINCPACQKPVSSEYARCPYCGKELRSSCRTCNTVLNPDWKMCPSCGTEIAEHGLSHIPPAPKKDKALKILVIALISLPILAIISGAVTLFVFRSGSGASAVVSQGYNINISEAADMEHFTDVESWINSCDAKGKGVYVLELSPERAKEREMLSEMSNSELKNAYSVYIYINQYKGTGESKLFSGSIAFNDNMMDIRYVADDVAVGKADTDYELSDICTTEYRVKGIRIYVDGKKVDFQLTELK